MAEKTPSFKSPFKISYPNVEKLIDSEDFSEINRSFGGIHQELSKIARSKGVGKTKTEARRAIRAIERVTDLLKELLKLKYRLMETADPTGKK